MNVVDYLDALNSKNQSTEVKKFCVLSNITYLKLETFVAYYSSVFKNGLGLEFKSFDVVEKWLYPDRHNNFIVSLCYDDLNEATLHLFLNRMRSILAQTKRGSVDCFFTVPLLPYFRAATKEAINELNNEIIDFCSINCITCLDLNELFLESVGSSAYELKHFFSKKILFSEVAESLIAKALVGYAMRDLNTTKKCLILDCDNTLWSGIIGEDGLSGIVINQHDDRGKIYYDLQVRLKALKDRGIVLCLATKNNLDDVQQAFTNLDMPLKWTDFSYQGASWDLKTVTISKISEYLNIGFESCVFLDDSPYEIGLVKASLPNVTCIMVPSQPYKIPLKIFPFFEYYFHTVSSSLFDRTAAYRVRESAECHKKRYTDHNDFLRSLSIKIKLLINDTNFVARYSEMTGRTNQFNSNKVHYTQAKINDFLFLDKNYLFAVETTDIFGSHGVTNLCFCREEVDNTIVVESFLMSCRVVERMIEYAFLKLLIQKMGWESRRIYIKFTKSEKNVLAYEFLQTVSNFYEHSGFELSHNKLNAVSTDFITGE
tara:strand:+ start:3205 stop:4833 length:1629 start_codon:yes stop_codon:yes gene_type:complete